MLRTRYSTICAAAMAVVFAAAAMARGAEDKQSKLIEIIKSDAPPQDKAIPCKLLAIYGNKEAVPALAALLPDKDLSSWARIALEANPDPSADDALRYALDKVQGRLLIGVINSIGYRRDPNAVEPLIAKMKGDDADVASAAAAALGKIGGQQAAGALSQYLPNAPAGVKSAVAEGCVLAAERFLAGGSRDQAIGLYDAVRRTDVPRQRTIEAVRGSILARQDAGIPLLIEQLRSKDDSDFAIGLRVARELQGAKATEALIAELPKAVPDRQALLIFALADRNDAKALPAVLEALKSGPIGVRVAAAMVLENLGNASCVSALLEAAAADDAQLAQAARTSLARLPGKEIDAEIFARLQQSSGKAKQILIELTEQRRVEGSIPLFVKYAEDPDAGVRSAALIAIGAIGEAKHSADLAKLLQKTQDAADRAAVEKALVAISSRWGAQCVRHLLPLAQGGEPATRGVALGALACCGGADALGAIRAAYDDKDETVQTEAVRALSTWPNRWPDDAAVMQPLLSIAKAPKKAQHQVLALRGYLQGVQVARKMNPAQKLAAVNEALPLISRPEEKRQAISVLSSIGNAGALSALVKFADDAGVREEACAAIVGLAGKNMPGASREQRRSALQAVVDRSQSEDTRKRAQELLNR